MQITIFKDIKETSQPFYRHVDIIIKRIREGASKTLVKKIFSAQWKYGTKILYFAILISFSFIIFFCPSVKL